MRKWLWLVAVVATAAGCGSGGSGLPQPGDTIRPGLTQTINWKAGEKAELWVDLQATNAQGKSRRLSHQATAKNPVAKIIFYDAEQQVIGDPLDLELSVRC
jgi:hypothetical protein